MVLVTPLATSGSGYETNRTGWLTGSIALESGAPDRGETVKTSLALYTSGSDLSGQAFASQELEQGGTFEFAGVPAGAGHTLVMSRAGFRVETRPVPTILSGETVTLGTVDMSVARGNITGIFRKGDQEESDEGHAGIRVTADLNGHVVMETYTQDDGSYNFPYPGLPVTVGLESYTVAAQMTGYFYTQVLGLSVADNDLTVIQPLPESPETPDSVGMQPVAGDFDLCDPNTDPEEFEPGDCRAFANTNLTSVGIKLRLKDGVTHYRAKVHETFDAETGEAELPWLSYDPNTIPLVDISGSDGMVNVYVQIKKNDAPGIVMSTSIRLDTTPPGVSSLELNLIEDALRADITNRLSIRVGVTPEAETFEYAAPLTKFEVTFLENEDTFADVPQEQIFRLCFRGSL